MSPPDQAELESRVQATDADELRATVRALHRAAAEYDRVAGEMNGLRAAASNFWEARSQRSFDSYATRLTGDLTDTAAMMRDMATHLAAHAEATETAQTRLRAAAGLASAGKYASNQTADDSAEQRWAIQATHDFHLSEQRLRRRLWQLGTDAPGGIPLPSLPPQPHQTWWQAELFPSAYGPQQWLDKNGVPQLGNPGRFDPDHPLYGYDEDGHIVPAYMADPMAEHMVQDGIPLTPIFRLLGIGGEEATAEEAEVVLARSIAQSRGFRAGHIDRHIREYYKLPGVEESDPPPMPGWAKDEFLRLLTRSATRSDRVFRWHLPGRTPGALRPTNALLYNDSDTQQVVVLQFYAEGDPAAGQFATAFRPTEAQIERMLKASTIAK